MRNSNQNSAPQLPGIQELRQHWDEFAEYFQQNFERSTLQLAHTLMVHLRLDGARALLEVGAGAGRAGALVRGSLPAACRQVVTDLSPCMAGLARRALPGGVGVGVADAERLPFPDGTFDRYLANLSLMLVGDPDRALSEARRVLQSGGLAAWSVWGRPEGSPLFTLPALAAERIGVNLPQKSRSNFHLGDQEALRLRVAGNGFGRVVTWYQTTALPISDGAQFADMVFSSPHWRPVLSEFSDSQQLRLLRELASLVDERLQGGRPVCLEGLVVTAQAE